jgi:hypothetical protein
MGGKCNHDRCPYVAGRSGYCNLHAPADPADDDADGREDEAPIVPAWEW